MLNFINLFFINFLFAHTDELKILAFSCNPKKFGW